MTYQILKGNELCCKYSWAHTSKIPWILGDDLEFIMLGEGNGLASMFTITNHCNLSKHLYSNTANSRGSWPTAARVVQTSQDIWTLELWLSVATDASASVHRLVGHASRTHAEQFSVNRTRLLFYSHTEQPCFLNRSAFDVFLFIIWFEVN